MCDYSLHEVATRPAKLEDKLVTTKFNITHGFAAVGGRAMSRCACCPARSLHSMRMSSADRYSISASCRARRSDSDLPASGRSIWTVP